MLDGDYSSLNPELWVTEINVAPSSLSLTDSLPTSDNEVQLGHQAVKASPDELPSTPQ